MTRSVARWSGSREITDIFPERFSQIRALSIFAGTGAVAAPFGLALGGVLTEVNWHLIFWINLPLGLAVAAVVLSSLPTPHPTPVPVDLLGAAAATGTLCLLALTAMSMAAAGVAAGTTIGAAGSALVCALAFALRHRHASHPLVPRALLRMRTVVVGNGLFVLVGTVMLGSFFFITLYLQETRGLPPLCATMAYLPVPFAMLGGTQLASRLIGRPRPRNTLGLGLTTQAVMLAAWALVMDSSGSLALTMVAPIVGWAIGMGISLVCSFVICTVAVPESLTGAASGLVSTAHQGGGRGRPGPGGCSRRSNRPPGRLVG